MFLIFLQRPSLTWIVMDEHEHGSILHYIVIPTLHHSLLTAVCAVLKCRVVAHQYLLQHWTMPPLAIFSFLASPSVSYVTRRPHLQHGLQLVAYYIVQNVAQAKLSNHDRLAA